MSKKKPLDPKLKAECDELNRIYLSKKNERQLSLKKLADAAGMSPPGIKHYLDGVNQLNAKIASLFAKALDVDVADFSPRLAAEIAQMAISARIDSEIDDYVAANPSLNPKDGPELMRQEKRKEAHRPTPVQILEATLLDAVRATHIVQASILDGSITKSQLERLMTIRHEIAQKGLNKNDPPAFPSGQLQGILEAAFRNAENGENPDDLVSMFKHGTNKNRIKDADQNGESNSRKRTK